MKIKKSLIGIIFLSVASISMASPLSPKSLKWPFTGMTGEFDIRAIQRGFQVYKEVCSACHGLDHLYYRNLLQIGFSEAEVKELASQFNVQDGPNSEGEMYDRPATLSDRFYNPFSNEEAARSANNGAHPVDLSLVIKARPNGANYVYSLLTGYQNKMPKGFNLSDGLYYNPYFHGMQIAMPQPLSDNIVTYLDGTNASVHQMSYDVVQFLQWAAEPEMMDRKSLGLKSLFFLLFFTVIFYIAKQRIWQNVK